MRGILKAIGIVSMVFLSIAQLVRVNRTNPPVESDVAAPENVKTALRAACYDCHSNETKWPWYSHFAPVSWVIAHDVREGREELNFSTWQSYDGRKQQKKLEETIESLNDGSMPPWYYRMAHPTTARLTEKDLQAMIAWARQGSGSVFGHVSAESDRDFDDD